MPSQIKRILTFEEISTLLQPLGSVEAVVQFEGGMFAGVACATIAGRGSVAVKSAPPGGTTAVLSHERDVIRAELEVLQFGMEHSGLRLPRLVMSDFNREIVDVDVIVTEVLEGERWDLCETSMSGPALRRAEYERGMVLAAYGRIRGERFGFASTRAAEYTSDGWHTTFTHMLTALLEDGERFGVDLRAADVLDAVARQESNLASVRHPILVHGDLWSGNVFVQPATGRLVGVIDPERAMWGDPLFDIAGGLQGSLEEPSRELVRGLRDAGGAFDASSAGRTRLDLYLLWFALCMMAEAGARGHLMDDPGARLEWLRPQVDALLARIP